MLSVCFPYAFPSCRPNLGVQGWRSIASCPRASGGPIGAGWEKGMSMVKLNPRRVTNHCWNFSKKHQKTMGWWRIQWFFSGFVNLSDVFDMFWCILICFLWHFIGVDSPRTPLPQTLLAGAGSRRCGWATPLGVHGNLDATEAATEETLGPLGPLGWWRGWWYVTTCYPLVMSK